MGILYTKITQRQDVRNQTRQGRDWVSVPSVQQWAEVLKELGLMAFSVDLATRIETIVPTGRTETDHQTTIKTTMADKPQFEYILVCTPFSTKERDVRRFEGMITDHLNGGFKLQGTLFYGSFGDHSG